MKYPFKIATKTCLLGITALAGCNWDKSIISNLRVTCKLCRRLAATGKLLLYQTMKTHCFNSKHGVVIPSRIKWSEGGLNIEVGGLVWYFGVLTLHDIIH